MKYEINLFPGKKRWEISIIRIGEGIRSFVTSTVFLLSVLGVLLGLTVFLTVVIPLHRVSPVHKTEIKNLELLLQGLKQETALLQQAERTVLQLKERGIRWEDKLSSLGKTIFEGVWLTRIAFEEGKEKGGGVRTREAPGVKRASGKRILTIEGAFKTKEGTPQIGVVARLIEAIQKDTGLQAQFDPFELKGIQSSKEEPEVIRFRLAAALKEGTPKTMEKEFSAAQMESALKEAVKGVKVPGPK